MTKTICVTGHRPKTLYGYDLTHPRWVELHDVFQKILVEKNCTDAITGMALGVDTVFALAVLDLRNKGYKIRLHCAVPCRNLTEPWFDDEDIWRFGNILERADEVVYVTDSEYVPGCLEERNKYMVNHSDEVIAVWNGEKKGGTFHCISYANFKNKPVTNIINQKGEIIYDRSDEI